MTMGLEPKWTDLSDMLATRTDDQLLKWKEVAENPRIDDYRTITTLRQLVVDLYNKSIKDIINELSIAVNDEINSRSRGINMDKKLEQRIAKLEKLLSRKNEAVDFNIADRVWEVAHQVSEANKAYMELRNDLVKANRESDEYEDIVEELNEAFDGLNNADQVLQAVARKAHRKYR